MRINFAVLSLVVTQSFALSLNSPDYNLLAQIEQGNGIAPINCIDNSRGGGGGCGGGGGGCGGCGGGGGDCSGGAGP